MALLCVLTWSGVLHLWERIGYVGSVEWWGVLVVRKLAGKASTKLNPKALEHTQAR